MILCANTQVLRRRDKKPLTIDSETQLSCRNGKEGPHSEGLGVKDNFLEGHFSHINDSNLNVASEMAAVLQPIRPAVEILHGCPSMLTDVYNK